jgi:hypothetical protein
MNIFIFKIIHCALLDDRQLLTRINILWCRIRQLLTRINILWCRIRQLLTRINILWCRIRQLLTRINILWCRIIHQKTIHGLFITLYRCLTYRSWCSFWLKCRMIVFIMAFEKIINIWLNLLYTYFSPVSTVWIEAL